MSATAAPRVIERTTSAWANWLWLVELPRRDAALVIGANARSLEDALGASFSSVGSRAALDVPLPFPDATYDCVVLDPAALDDGRRREAQLREVCRVLRPGGCIHVSGANGWWHGAWRSRSSASSVVARTLVTELMEAGFRDVRSWYVVPLASSPTRFVPATAEASIVYERLQQFSDPMVARVRTLAARVGLHRVLYPSILHVAFA